MFCCLTLKDLLSVQVLLHFALCLILIQFITLHYQRGNLIHHRSHEAAVVFARFFRILTQIRIVKQQISEDDEERVASWCDLIGCPAGEEHPAEEVVRPADAAQRRLGQTDHVRECEYDEADDTHRCDDVLQGPNSRETENRREHANISMKLFQVFPEQFDVFMLLIRSKSNCLSCRIVWFIITSSFINSSNVCVWKS